MYNHKIYSHCIPCSGTGSKVDYEYNTRYDLISKSYRTLYQRVTKTCFRCSGTGKVVDQIATKEFQQQQRIKQQKRKQEQQKRIQNQKKQAEYKEFILKNNMWEQYVDNYNKDITQPLLGQKTYQKVEEKPQKQVETFIRCGVCDGKGYDIDDVTKKCRKCEGSGGKKIKNEVSSFSEQNSYKPLPIYQPPTFNNQPYQPSQPIVSKKKTEQQLRQQFQKMYEAQKRRLKRLQQQKRQEQQRERRRQEQRYKKIRQKQEQQKAIKQQQFYQSPQGRAYVEEQKIKERRRQRKDCIKNALLAIFCCCGQVDDNKCICWILIFGISLVFIMWFVLYPIIVSS